MPLQRRPFGTPAASLGQPARQPENEGRRLQLGSTGKQGKRLQRSELPLTLRTRNDLRAASEPLRVVATFLEDPHASTRTELHDDDASLDGGGDSRSRASRATPRQRSKPHSELSEPEGPHLGMLTLVQGEQLLAERQQRISPALAAAAAQVYGLSRSPRPLRPWEAASAHAARCSAAEKQHHITGAMNRHAYQGTRFVGRRVISGDEGSPVAGELGKRGKDGPAVGGPGPNGASNAVGAQALDAGAPDRPEVSSAMGPVHETEDEEGE